jgi:hypothetical protein
VLRSSPFARQYWEWTSFGQTYADTLSPHEHQAVVAMTARRHGEESAALAAHWLEFVREVIGVPARHGG